jgi:superfamily II RNA helicase
MSETTVRPSLLDRVPTGGSREPEEILDAFLGWVVDTGLEPYPAQEEALLELFLGRHVVLSTPTGSGKSLVALGLHFKGLCEGERSFYTAPVKALTSEKFFALCEEFGPENVGMLTGDASINPDAPILCCTTEVVASMALRQGEAAPISSLVLDEFHFYDDAERGVHWQIPLIALPHTQLLLMSATLGNTAPIEERIAARSGREVSHVHSTERPVPLDFEYRETPLHETIEALVGEGRAPVYVVHFTQRECSEQAQALTSAKLASREQKRAVSEELGSVRFDTPFGKTLKRILGHGIGVHHAGLLPRYRLLVERLAQRGLLRVICGTDTLGVGVNIPIRTVLFTRLCKYDGEKVAILSVRNFKQIAGRAGRKGFDELGSVVCQAPEHVIENKRLAARAVTTGRKKVQRKSAPTRGFVAWNADTFERLAERPPEPLASHFRIDHGMVVSVLQREDLDPDYAGGYRALMNLIANSHESDVSRARHRRHAARMVRGLRAAEIVEVLRGPSGSELRVAPQLQIDFSLHHTLSLFLVEAVASLDPQAPGYPMEVLSLVEAIQENPRPILQAQVNKAKGALVSRLKAEGVPYEDRMRQLEDVTYPKPEAEFIEGSFRVFAERHPWVKGENIHPKSIAREIWEEGRGFVDFVKEYELARSEGLLLRYLSQVHNTVVRSIPVAARTDELIDLIAYFHAMLERVDTSLVDAWATLLDPEAAAAAARPQAEAPPFDLARHERLLAARVRAELHRLVRALAQEDWDEAAASVRQLQGEPWDAARFEQALAPFLEEYARIVFTPDARQAHRTLLKPMGDRRWEVFQTLVDPEGDELWAIEGEIDLRGQRDPDGALVAIRRIGT